MVEIFVEFLIHEEGLKQLEEYHISLLNEIVDSTCARINGQKLEDYVPADYTDTCIPDAKKHHLHEDILKSVEQELIKLVQAKA